MLNYPTIRHQELGSLVSVFLPHQAVETQEVALAAVTTDLALPLLAVREIRLVGIAKELSLVEVDAGSTDSSITSYKKSNCKNTE